jgi:F-type H+-transporting ATPase subunit gamma
MNMVATSRLRGAQANMDAFRPYAGKFAEVLGSWRKRPVKKPTLCWFPKKRSKRSISFCAPPTAGCAAASIINLIDKAENLMEKSGGDAEFR